MTVKQALKQKNKLVQELNELTLRLHKNNSVVEGNTRAYSSIETLKEIYSKVDELTAIKTQIHKANVEVYDKIFLLSELKSIVKQLKGLDCSEGVTEDYYSRRNETQTIKNAEIGEVQRDMEVKFLEARIEELQDELDLHNATTMLPSVTEETE
jgi:hypothetical protein